MIPVHDGGCFLGEAMQTPRRAYVMAQTYIDFEQVRVTRKAADPDRIILPSVALTQPPDGQFEIGRPTPDVQKEVTQ